MKALILYAVLMDCPGCSQPMASSRQYLRGQLTENLQVVKSYAGFARPQISVIF